MPSARLSVFRQANTVTVSVHAATLAVLLLVPVFIEGCKGTTLGADNKYGEPRVLAMFPVPVQKLADLVLGPPRIEGPLSAQVVSVLDGGALTVRIDDWEENVQLIGVSAPEMGQEPWGGHARDALRAFLEGKTVRLETDITLRDEQQRLLAYIFVGDVFVNLEMLRRGHAMLETILPNIVHEAEYRRAQEEARTAGRGIWDPANPLVRLPR